MILRSFGSSSKQSSDVNVLLCGALLRLFSVSNYVFHITVEEAAEVVYRLCGDRLVVFQTVKQTAADAEFVNKLICGHAFALQCLVKGIKGNQSTVPPKKSGLIK